VAERCVISYSIWGNDVRYLGGMMENLRLAPSVYPGWEVRVYLPEKHPLRLPIKQAGGVPVGCKMDKRYGMWQGLYWRMRVALDETVDRWIARDADDPLRHPQAACVKEWMESGKSYHIIHNRPTQWRPVLGGLWGGVHSPWLRGVLDSWGIHDAYGSDENMLQLHVWPRIKDDCLCHGFSTKWAEGKPIAG